ncbi:MAG: 50S ribosomal protein L18 [Tissierellia bacterium]|jgi:large subunit ribosomal protein L18|nr:50S ribosomal protein L18 [Tissierellia bacterium]
MRKEINRNKSRLHRHKRVRGKISGTPEVPRLCVFRSNKYIYAQIIDDVQGTTLVSASSMDPEVKADFSTGANKEAAKAVGQLIGKKAMEKGITKIVFDRGGYIYHGRVKELAEGARESGLQF